MGPRYNVFYAEAGARSKQMCVLGTTREVTPDTNQESLDHSSPQREEACQLFLL